MSDADLLQAWERASGLPRPWRELELLAAVYDERADDLALLPVGTVDRRLLVLRRSIFGDVFEGETDCPDCGERLGFALDLSDITTPATPGPESNLSFDDAGIAVVLRLPDTVDLAAAASSADPAETLFDRCVSARQGDSPMPLGDLPGHMREQAEARIAAADPQADVVLRCACDICGSEWDAPFDPAIAILGEIETHGRRLLDEVDDLARAYGWSEAQILALGQGRRAQYLQRVAR